MLHLCTVQKTCLLLETATRLQASQPVQKGFPFDVTLSKAVTELIAAKRVGNRRPVYLKSLSHYLSRFIAGRENDSLFSISAAAIEDWLKQFPSAYSRQTWLNRISTLFSFAVRRNYILVNPCEQIERVTVDKKPPKIFNPSQVDLLLKITPAVCLAYLLLGLFAGIRPDELTRLSWDDVNLETRTVRVNDAKTRRRRIVPLETRLLALIQKCPLQKGRIAPSNSTLRRWKRKARAALGLPEWPKDVLRHTAASYLLAKHKDAGKVATMLGNSPAILLSHYHEPVTESECQAFWHPDQADWPKSAEIVECPVKLDGAGAIGIGPAVGRSDQREPAFNSPVNQVCAAHYPGFFVGELKL